MMMIQMTPPRLFPEHTKHRRGIFSSHLVKLIFWGEGGVKGSDTKIK